MSKRKDEDKSHFDRLNPNANATSRFSMDKDRAEDPAKKASADVMAGRKIANIRGSRSSKSPQPQLFSNQSSGNVFGSQVNGTSNTNMSNGTSQPSGGFSFGSASQSFPPSNSNNNVGFGQPQSSVSFPAPQSGGLFSGMSGNNNTGSFNFTSGTNSNPFANMSQSQGAPVFGQGFGGNSTFGSSSNVFGQPQQGQQQAAPVQNASSNAFQSNGPFARQQSPSIFQFGQTSSNSPTPEPAPAPAPQKATPLFGQSNQTPSNPFANISTKPPETSFSSGLGNSSTPTTTGNSFQQPNSVEQQPAKAETSGQFSPFQTTTQAPQNHENSSTGFKPAVFSTSSTPNANESSSTFGTPQAARPSNSSTSLFATTAAEEQKKNAASVSSEGQQSISESNRPPSPTKRINPFANIKTTIGDQASPVEASSKPSSLFSSPQKTHSSMSTSSAFQINAQVQTQPSTQAPSPQSTATAVQDSDVFQPSPSQPSPSKPSTTSLFSNTFKPPQNPSILSKSSNANDAASTNSFFTPGSDATGPAQTTGSKSTNIFQSSLSTLQPSYTAQSSETASTSAAVSLNAEQSFNSSPLGMVATGTQAGDLNRYASLKSFNRSFIAALQSMGDDADFTPLFEAYRSELGKIQHNIGAGTKRKADEDLSNTTPKKSRASILPPTTPNNSASKSQTSSIIDDVLGQPSSAASSPSKSATNASLPTVNEFTTLASTDNAAPNASKQSTTNGAVGGNVFAGANHQVPKSSTSSGSTSTGFFPQVAQTSTPSSKAVTGFMPSTTGGGQAGNNFFAQFGKKAEKTAEETKKRRKAEEFDSDEDNEEEWERKYEEEQRAKKRKIEEEAKQNKTEYNKDTGFTFKKSGEAAGHVASDLQAPKVSNPSEAASTLTNPQESTPKSSTPNPFAHLSDSAATDHSGDEGDDESDGGADGNGDGESGDAYSQTGHHDNTQSDSGRSLFDRVTKGDKPLFNRDGTPTDSVTENKFGFGAPTNGSSPFGQQGQNASNLFTPKSSNAGEDHTWKPDSPLKFASSNTPKSNIFGNPNNAVSDSVPAFSFTSATPNKAEDNKPTSIFQTPAKGNLGETTTPESRPFKNLFGSNTPAPSPSLFANQSTTPAGALAKPSGFSFGTPPKNDALFPSSNLSRATTPGDATSANESAADTDNDDTVQPDEQTDLTSLTAQERQTEELIFEQTKVKLNRRDVEKKSWESKGTGPFRILKNKESGVVRALMRASPSGRIVMNTRLQSSISYKHVAKCMVQFATFDENGPQTWIVKTARDEEAASLTAAMEESKL